MSEGLDSRIEALEAEMKWRRNVLGKLSAKVTAAFFGGIAAAFIQVFLPMVYVQDQVVAHRLMAVDENHNPVVVLRSFADANGKGTFDEHPRLVAGRLPRRPSLLRPGTARLRSTVR